MWTQHTKFAAPAKPATGVCRHCGVAIVQFGGSESKLWHDQSELVFPQFCRNSKGDADIQHEPLITIGYSYQECAANGSGPCRIGKHGPNGELQCEWCGEPPCDLMPDPLEGMRGMKADDAEALIKECCAQAGYADTTKLKPAAWNILHRVVQAAHKAGAQARDAALKKAD